MGVRGDGFRITGLPAAHAGAASFRRRERLEACLAEATAQVKALKQEVHDDPGCERGMLFTRIPLCNDFSRR